MHGAQREQSLLLPGREHRSVKGLSAALGETAKAAASLKNTQPFLGAENPQHSGSAARGAAAGPASSTSTGLC